jgi:hypothetical protein
MPFKNPMMSPDPYRTQLKSVFRIGWDRYAYSVDFADWGYWYPDRSAPSAAYKYRFDPFSLFEPIHRAIFDRQTLLRPALPPNETLLRAAHATEPTASSELLRAHPEPQAARLEPSRRKQTRLANDHCAPLSTEQASS